MHDRFLSITPDQLTGRELDAAVARRVFGYEIEPRRSARTGEQAFLYNAEPESRVPVWGRVPLYTTDMAASLHLELHLQKCGWRRVASNSKDIGDGRVILRHTDGRTVEAFGLASVALCRAALKAV